ncbi:carbohydrate kinase family protein [Herbiconiux sp.]|uniref:carbohydrate kinase family protein n=1 Tax=Herbiconiux sp. TaxID=1871186 RepID=UPI0025C39D03|nr:carbohydrate kinase family protein [Herbiconiux sp.]
MAGHVCIDEIVTADGTSRTAGSPAVFISPVLRERGSPAVVIAPYGSDFTAVEHDLELLPSAQVDRTLVFVNDVRSARRTQAVRNGEAATLPSPGQAALDALGAARALILTPLLPDPPIGIVREYVAALPTGALRVILLQGYLRRLSPHLDARGNTPVATRPLAELDALLPLFDIAVLSDEDLSGDVDGTVGAWSAAHPSSAIVVTRGARGASLFTGGERTDAPAHDVGPLPPEALVGAGDIFSAELTAALLAADAPRDRDRDATGASNAPAPDRGGSLLAAVRQANHATALRLAARLEPRADVPAPLEPISGSRVTDVTVEAPG